MEPEALDLDLKCLELRSELRSELSKLVRRWEDAEEIGPQARAELVYATAWQLDSSQDGCRGLSRS